MGNEHARLRIEGPLIEVLKANGTPLKPKTARKFLQTVSEVAPWFLEEGLLNIPQWEHLGEDLRRCPTVREKDLTVWALVRSCLTSPRQTVQQTIQVGEDVLKEDSCGGSKHKTTGESESSDSETEAKVKSIYPDIKDLRQRLQRQTPFGDLGIKQKVNAVAQHKLESKVEAVAQHKLKPEVKAETAFSLSKYCSVLLETLE